MRLFRSLAPLVVALLPGALAAQAPAQLRAGPTPAQVRIPGMSPAGDATIARLQAKPDPAVAAQARDEAALRAEMAAVLKAPAVDVERLAAVLKRGEGLAARGRALADDHMLAMLRALSPPDRLVLVRAIATARPGPPPAR